MKRFLIGLGTVAVVLVNPVTLKLPVWGQIQQLGETVTQNLRQENPVIMELSVEKRLQIAEDSDEQWQALSGEQVQVKPDDTLRYQLKVKNTGERLLENLAVTQPIPERTAYILDSATSEQSAVVGYSIDGGINFLAEPTILVTLADGSTVSQPAPADMYTHVRWDISQVQPETDFAIRYQVKVQ